MAKTAILVDGGFYRKRSYALWGDKVPAARADELVMYAFKHIDKMDGPFRRELYRIFYYDCPPIDTNVFNPLTGKSVNLKKDPTYAWANEFFDCLKRKRKLALRMGRISVPTAGYDIDRKAVKKLCRGDITVADLTESDFHPAWQQKGVDMKLGLDVSSLAYEGIVSQIVLIAGDSDFVPAAKVARRKGIDFILDPMGASVSDDLFENIDGLESFVKKDPGTHVGMKSHE